MAEVAAHLVDRVLPKAAYRQWTLSVPYELRLPMAANPSVLSDVLRRFIQEVFTYKRRRARAHGVLDPKPGAISFVQRFGSILNLHPHFHTSIADGVFAQDEAGRARWVPLDGPIKQDIEHLAHRVSTVVRRYFEQEHACEMAGGAQDDGDLQTLAEAIKRPGLPAQGRSPAARVRDDAALVDGFSLHVGRAIKPDDRHALERMLRYGSRPAFAQSRLSLTASGKVCYRLKRPWHTGQTHITLAPVDFLRRLTSLIPPPRSHLTRFHGAFAPRAKIRRALFALVPGTEAECVEVSPSSTSTSTSTAPSSEEPEDQQDNRCAKRKRMKWATLFGRVFSVDVTRCADPLCGGKAKVIAWITNPDAIEKILVCLDLDSPPLVIAPARAPPQIEMSFSDL